MAESDVSSLDDREVNKSTSNDCQSNVSHDSSVSDQPVSLEKETVSTESVPSKRVVSRKVHDVFADMFGEASDEEVDPQEEELESTQPDGDVMEVEPVSKSPQPVIDLTEDSHSENECPADSHGAGEGDRLDHSEHLLSSHSEQNSKSSKHNHTSTKNRKLSSKSSRQSSSSEPDVRGQTKETTHIAVSSSGDADQCKELFEMFREEKPLPVVPSNDDVVSEDSLSLSFLNYAFKC